MSTTITANPNFPTRKIGDADVSAIGFGAMGMSAFYTTSQEAKENYPERYKILDPVLAQGCTYWDSADVYDDNEILLAKWFEAHPGKRQNVFLATKFGFTANAEGKFVINGTKEYVAKAFEKSIARLGPEVKYVDLYYLHRPDPNTPIEETVGAMAELVKAGKVKYLGLSECSGDTLRRAYAVHPIAAVQVEYSPFCIDIEDENIGLMKAARELGVTIVAYSPLGRGLLTGQYKSRNDFAEDDFRRTVPKFSDENFPNVLKLVDDLKAIGQRHTLPDGSKATAGQVTLSWILGQGNDIIPIPGTRKEKYLIENLGAINVKLTPEELKEVRDAALKADVFAGDRYGPGMQEMLFVDTPPLKN